MHLEQISGLSGEYLENIRTILGGNAEVERAVIFGSRAKGTFKKGSDVDLCLFGAAVTPTTVAHIRDILEEETMLPYFFDVVGYELLESVPLKEHIERVGQEIFRRV